MIDNETFRKQVELAAAFVTTTMTFSGEERNELYTKFADVSTLWHTLMGMQTLLGYTLNKIALLDGTHTGKMDEVQLRKLQEVMLSFHRYDATCEE